MKNIRKIFCVFLIISLFISVPVLNASGIENKGFDDQFKDIGNESKGRICDYDGTEILKEVSQEPDEDGNYEITLTVKGKPKKVTKPVDILLIMDASNSMYYNMDELKASMNSLVDKVIDNIPDSRIAVVAFGTYSEEVFSFNNKNNFTSKEEYKKAIKKSYNNIEGRGNTNIESSWRLADEIFKNELNNNFNSKKDVIFFSDGYPNESMNMLLESKYLEGGREYYEQYKKHLEQIYKTKIKKDSDYEKILMDELNNGNYKSIDEWALYEYEKFYNNYPDTNIFSVALIDNIPYEDKNSAKELLSKMQNSGYFTIDSRFGQDNNENNSKSLKEIYDKIANNIILDKEMAKGLKITDVVSKDFEIVKNGAYDGKNSKIVNLSDNSVIDLKENIEGDKISWDRGENIIDSTDGIQFKFKIKPKDQYWGTGENKVYTNDIATISYKKPKEKNKIITGIFNKPNLSVPYKLGKIKVTKKFFGEDGKEIKVDDKKTYTVCIDGGDLGKYYLKVDGNGNAKVLDFYMRDENTDISNNTDTKKGYLKVTESSENKRIYKVSEIDTMDSETKSIFVNGSKNDSFELNMQNNNIDIVINSSIKDEKYFYDNKEKINDFGILKLN
ncbi:VWA domain-containing protein [Clostridium perfringens]|uniref:VWA domain-containing protein n=3 Tax=Clostridium perfringens TaxID=1502 RepID=A0AAW9IGG5_CLOPF|nr:vWA domain-containing protein [Clostridium perfringens]ALG47897.1 von Willebrand factor type A domain protein [Clostridium perfringens]EIF6165057.1 VWA domain-containing protein [Clostridium perfringens]EIF6168312.1 VWA domain-containing protein [Clostridium perfringens]EIL8447459.1 VWA domain-containing protein [Clostridium perfringens]EJT6535204.1 VWA domain-containing protein [Clostridium perfringens]